MKRLRSEFRKYSKMYFDAVFHLCYSRSLVDHGNSQYLVWCSFYASQVKLLFKLRTDVWKRLIGNQSDIDFCKEISDKFRNELLTKLTLRSIDHSYYYEL